MKRLWLVRLGRNGEYESAALDDNLPQEIRATLPLQRTWTQVPEDDEDAG